MNQQLDLSLPSADKGSHASNQKAGETLSFKTLMERFYDSLPEAKAGANDTPAKDIFVYKPPAKHS